MDRYHGPEGDRFAHDELVPVARRFLSSGSRVLEVGCGYGRNLVALTSISGVRATGCDVTRAELEQAAKRLASRTPPACAGLVQQEPYRLPFRDQTFDMVVLWQVLEHVFGNENKQRVIDECIRTLRSGGHLLIETPNQWFPFDYHDNKLPLVHWILPKSAREWLTWKVRGMRYPPSEYLSVPGYERLLRRAPQVTRVEKATRVYFAESYGEAWRGLAGTQVGLKRVLFTLAAPIHALLTPFGQSADLVLPSIRVVWRVEKG